jgi:hypothetical protein
MKLTHCHIPSEKKRKLQTSHGFYVVSMISTLHIWNIRCLLSRLLLTLFLLMILPFGNTSILFQKRISEVKESGEN